MGELEGTTAVSTDHGPLDGGASSSLVIEVDRLNVTYGDFRAVKDLSFHVERGEVYALLGTNGAGKTSALEVIEGHRRVSSGTVRVFGASPRTGGRCGPGWGSCSKRAGSPPISPSQRRFC